MIFLSLHFTSYLFLGIIDCTIRKKVLRLTKNKPLGQELLVDFFTCYEGILSSANLLTEALSSALDAADCEVTEINCQTLDDEIIIYAPGLHTHIILHAYASLGYATINVFTFNMNTRPMTIIRELKHVLGPERIKATSVQRAAFGIDRDMKPRRHTTLTALGRMTRTSKKLKKTGGKLIKVIAKRKKNKKTN